MPNGTSVNVPSYGVTSISLLQASQISRALEVTVLGGETVSLRRGQLLSTSHGMFSMVAFMCLLPDSMEMSVTLLQFRLCRGRARTRPGRKLLP